jgi:hypothetical protein
LEKLCVYAVAFFGELADDFVRVHGEKYIGSRNLRGDTLLNMRKTMSRKSLKVLSLAFICVLSAMTARAQPSKQQQLAELDRTFVCPESLPSDAARKDAVKLFVEQYAAIHPETTIAQFTYYRISLLEKHHCSVTLAAMGLSDSPAAPKTTAAWKQAGRIGVGDGAVMTIFVDLNSMVNVGGGQIRTWIKYENSRSIKGIKDTLAYEQIDCIHRVHGTISLFSYAAGGQIVHSEKGNAESGDPIIPDSVLAGILPFTCAAGSF